MQLRRAAPPRVNDDFYFAITVATLNKYRRFFIFLGLTLWTGAVLGDELAPQALVTLPLDQLMNLEVTTASKFPQKKMDAPTAVTVITAEDIKDYGYRTLADVLRSIRGVYTSYDRVYEYVGLRGFGRSGDYNSRLLLMIDGRRVNEVIYDQAYIGNDGPVDMEDVSRIEFVPGSGSALYGSNAFFGVVNIITKSGKDLQGGQVAGGFGSFGMDREKGSLGYRFDNGADLLLSASRQRSDGHRSLSFDRFDQSGVAPFTSHQLDGSKTDRLFGKFSYQDFALEGAFSDRSKAVPIALYGVDIDVPETYRDRNGFAEARYEKKLTDGWTGSARAYWGFYDFDGRYYYSKVRNADVQASQWWGTEVKSVLDLGSHKLVLGAEYQSNFVQEMANFDIAPDFSYLNVSRSSHRYGFYLQDEFAITRQLTLNAGARYDYYSVSGGTANPRIGLIYKPWDDIAFKVLYGTAFRAPNLFELHYVSPSQMAAGSLRPEKIESVEGVVEYQASRHLRLTATAFDNQVTDLINLTQDAANPAGLLVYHNNQQVSMQGLEFESEYRWENGARLRGSYTFSYAKDLSTRDWLENSPKHLAKLNASVPVWRDSVRAGAELQYVGERKSKVGETPGYALTNLTLTADKLIPNLEVSASVYNLLGKRYFNPAGGETIVDQIPQDGRNFRLWFSYRF